VVLATWAALGPLAAPALALGDCAPENESTGNIPLQDLVGGSYEGIPGGLYPGGANTMPQDHLARGLELARQVQPLDASGNPDPVGSIVLLTVGMSNAEIESQPIFDKLQESGSGLAEHVVMVNGAKGGRDSDKMSDPRSDYWVGPGGGPGILDNRLLDAGVADEQVQVIFLKQALGGNNDLTFTEYTSAFEEDMIAIIQALQAKFPNLKVMYLENRSYGGYGTTQLNPEPFAYWISFGDKWLIEAQLSGDPRLNADPDAGPVVAPWLAWGPTLWADGVIPRSDGLTWVCDDFQDNGVHVSDLGADKVANLAYGFVHSDFTAQQWFLQDPPPIAEITDGPADLTNQLDATVAFSADDPQATFACSLDGGPATPCRSPVRYIGLSEGAHAFAVTPTDAAGQAGAPARRMWTVDITAPAVVPDGIEMFDVDRDGKVDTVTVRFTEPITPGPQDLTRWALTGVPSDGTLVSVTSAGDTVTLTLSEGPGAADTAVRAFRVALSKGLAGVRDLAGNQGAFEALPPVDRAAPVPTVTWDTNGTEEGRMQPGDTFGFTFSEPLAPATIPLTTSVVEADPAGPGPDKVTIAGLLQGSISLAADGYVKKDGRTVTYDGIMWFGPNVRTVMVTVGSSCMGVCGSLGSGGPATVVFVPASTLTDVAGNVATGSIALVNLAMF
jgi:hypothetical protein